MFHLFLTINVENRRFLVFVLEEAELRAKKGGIAGGKYLPSHVGVLGGDIFAFVDLLWTSLEAKIPDKIVSVPLMIAMYKPNP